MKTIRAIWKNREIVLSEPADWPDGTPLAVEPLENATVNQQDILGDDPEPISHWLTWYDTLEPLVFTAEEEAAFQSA